MTTEYRFHQLDVFSLEPFLGNPLAVVHAAQDLDEVTMAAFARWTNLSETTFLLPPTRPDADYRLRIFTPGSELPFAGHPTLGSCQAWLAAGGMPKSRDLIVQECGVGLVRIRRGEGRLAFAAPPLRRTGPLDEPLLRSIAAALGVERGAIVRHQWVDNGPGWCAVMLGSADEVLAIRPDFAALGDLRLGVVGPHPAGSEQQFEVRAFVPGLGVPEDPVTGSLNAGLARWLIDAGVADHSYVVSQGTRLQRRGRVYVDKAGPDVWIGGYARIRLEGSLHL